MINNLNVNKMHDQFKRNKPFKHVVIDNFFTPDIAEFLEKNFSKDE